MYSKIFSQFKRKRLSPHPPPPPHSDPGHKPNLPRLLIKYMVKIINHVLQICCSFKSRSRVFNHVSIEQNTKLVCYNHCLNMVVRINGITYFGIILFSTKRHLIFFCSKLYFITSNRIYLLKFVLRMFFLFVWIVTYEIPHKWDCYHFSRGIIWMIFIQGKNWQKNGMLNFVKKTGNIQKKTGKIEKPKKSQNKPANQEKKQKRAKNW